MKEDFKNFVRKNPNLAKYVEMKKMTWQQFYELYNLYGEDNIVWNDFKEIENTNTTNFVDTIKNFLDLFKGIDLKTLQKALVSASKAIDAFKSFNDSEEKENNNLDDNKYKYFED